MKKKNILVLGGAGFIGGNLVAEISRDSEARITVADSFLRGRNDTFFKELIKKENIDFIEEDFTNPKSFELLRKDYDQFYMLASLVGVKNSVENPHEIIRINTSLILNSLNWLANSKIKKVLFSSTSENYSGTVESFNYKVPTPEEVPLTISDISNSRSAYAVTKILGESGFLNFSHIFNFECTIVRYHNVFGPRMGFQHVIPNLVKRFLIDEERPFKIYGGNHTRSFCYISDAINATLLAMNSNISNKQIYNIGNNEEITIDSLVKEIGNYFEYKDSYLDKKPFLGSVSRRCPDISKAQKDLSFHPVIHWKDGLIETLKWYENFYKEGGKENGFA
tara:strand:+ start:2832 stop:3839 length:1008 start_codon:yes stop_codon:yes gene_type:complete